MGLFGIFSPPIGATGRTGKKISFKTKKKLDRQDIVDLVWNIRSLDTEQKKLVKEFLVKELDDGGVSKWEFEKVMLELYRRRVELKLSEVDLKNLKKILYE